MSLVRQLIRGVGFYSTGTQPYVARDLLQFPVCTQGSGLIDVVVQSRVSTKGPYSHPFTASLNPCLL